MHVAPPSTATVQDHVALAEIELCGELIIAASAADEERLSPDRIDEVLKVAAERSARPGSRGMTGGAAGRPSPRPWRPARMPGYAGCVGRTGASAGQVRSRRAIAFVASSTFASISSPPLTAASATQCRRCSSSSWSAKDCRALVDAETWVSMSMQ